MKNVLIVGIGNIGSSLYREYGKLVSRSDFDVCDMVEEIRKRVDMAGVGRDLITIEITESVIGGDFDFMKTAGIFLL